MILRGDYIKFTKKDDFMQDVVQQAKARRRELGVTLRDVAALSGLGINALSRFEQGDGGMSLKNVCTVLDVLGLRLVVLPKRKPE